MSTKPPDKTATPTAGPESQSDPDDSSLQPHERIYQEAMSRLAVIGEEWEAAKKEVWSVVVQ